MNDDLRQVKDFRAIISEKTEPKSLRILKKTVHIMIVFLIILTCKI